MFAKVLLVAAVAGLASAEQLPSVAKREFLDARQDLSDECQSAITAVLPLYSSLPTPAADLENLTLDSDPCATPTLTGSVASDFSSYSSAVLDWYTSNSAELNSALASCSELSAYASEVPICSSAIASITSGATSATATSDSTSSTGGSSKGSSSTGGSASATQVSQGGAPRETGFVFAAGAAGAALMAAVAAL
ncbi:hypothetical protein F5Y15DRAFT_382660 [Xylariaceae sp. FL0016]|nr:hypothetical protein F5Y15DRAFT_382660 [Xylariaceae sp. FL0016]